MSCKALNWSWASVCVRFFMHQRFQEIRIEQSHSLLTPSILWYQGDSSGTTDKRSRGELLVTSPACFPGETPPTESASFWGDFSSFFTLLFNPRNWTKLSSLLSHFFLRMWLLNHFFWCCTVSYWCIKMKLGSFVCWTHLNQSLLILSPQPHISGALVHRSLSLSLPHSVSESTLIIADSHMFSPLPPPRPVSPTPPVLFLWCWRQVGHQQLEDCFQWRERKWAEGDAGFQWNSFFY